MAERLKVRCPTCLTSSRPGLLWLGGADWVECPSCDASGHVELVEQRFAPRERLISVPGVGSISVPVHHPTTERCM